MKNVLKLFGILLFVLIVSRIDRSVLFVHLQKTNLPILIAAFPVLLLMYVCKTARWRAIVRALGVRSTLRDSWEIYNIGIFLGVMTPGKIGELGRAAYLKTAGMSNARAIGAAIFDRGMDIVMIGLLAIGALGILFGPRWTGLGMVAVLFVLVLIRRYSSLLPRVSRTCVYPVILWTICSWSLYFTWALLVARATGIDIPATVIIAAFTLTGIIVLIPIAPSGLGTRDAALITLLAPYHIATEQAVALAFLMFISIVLSSTIGGYYYLKR